MNTLEIPESPLIGRKHELRNLELITHKKTASLVVVKGRRRIGKSRLLMEVALKHGGVTNLWD